MASSSAGRAKRDRERARQDKAKLKRERRLGGPDPDVESIDADGEIDSTVQRPPRPQVEVLAELAELHRRFDDDEINLDDFESAKADLIGELDV
jgi:hypothetical protein